MKTRGKKLKLKRDDIYSYIIKRYDDTSDSIYPRELAKYFKLTIKQIDNYILKLEEENLVRRLKDTCPQPILPTFQGRKNYYDKILTLFPHCIQRQIKKLITIDIEIPE